ncbi:beta-ketoacyl-ACP synthase III [Lacticigenium naphthae]|uniref:beta-ketoacyl-ACP synthase III n=1 Tax=Lacticigenium naphthae TaxID=515351 RepID=UPI0004106D3D|nr:beta-ketoacyl-ACP synthase III [Lacticigenium naphthae]
MKIQAIGKYVPENVLTNQDLEKIMDTSNDWIVSRTGIKKRHITTDDTTSSLAVKAAQNILNNSQIKATEIDFIIVATMTPDSHSPSVAAIVQSEIGANSVMAFDVSAACSGFVYALSIAEKMLQAESVEYGLVIGAETMSQTIDWSDRSTAVLFGDGAGGVIVKSSIESSLLAEDIHADGKKGNALVSGKIVNDAKTGNDKWRRSPLTMDGRDIYNFVVKEVPNSIRTVTKKANLELKDIDYFLLHQANERLIKQVSKKLALDSTKFPSNIAEYGNTSAASIPLLLAELVENQTIQLESGQKLLLSGFGGGLTWGSLVITI